MNETSNQAAMPPPPQNPGPIQTAPEKAAKNPIGTIALILAIIGFIFACIPGALIVGWILLPIAFVLSLVSLFMAGKSKTSGIIALIITIVGAIVAPLVFLFVVVDAVDEAFSEEVTATTPDGEESESDDKQGTRDNPYPIGTTVESDDWAVTVNSVDLDATQKVLDENPFNDEPESGNAFILVHITAKYVGDDAEGDIPWVSVDFVTAGGNTINASDTWAVAPDEFDSMETLYSGASTEGNIVIEVPEAEVDGGLLAVEPGLFSDKVFVSIK